MDNLDFEYFDLFCTNIFGGKDDLYTFQEYTFAYFVQKHPNYWETLGNMEHCAIEFLSWQNVSIPNSLFCFNNGFESHILSSYMHDNDFTWNKCITTLKEAARRAFISVPEFPETKESHEKRQMRENFKTMQSVSLDSFFESRDSNAR